MSCSMTIPAVRARTKTVTRRHVDTWKDLKPGDRLTLIEKGMGLPKGAQQVKLAQVEIVDVRVETLGMVTFEKWATKREGLPAMSAAEFIRFWCSGHGYPVLPFNEAMMIECRRIEWRYLDDTPSPACDIAANPIPADVTPAKHCAKFSPPIMRTIATVLAAHLPVPGPLLPAPSILDPFAGVGGVHELQTLGYRTVGVEIEPRWAAAHPNTFVGDATALDFPDGSFDAVVTSPVYGNRMSDTYTGERDTCKQCEGTGVEDKDDEQGAVALDPCKPCGGTGFKASTRYTYTVYNGAPLAENNAGAMQWGPAYRALHRAAWAETARVLTPAGLLVLNISDHYRADRLQGVDLWHANELGRHGFELLDQHPVKTSRSRNGANSELRDSCEWVLVFRRGER